MVNVLTKELNETRSQIERVAIDLFAKRGYSGTSIRDICEASGVTRPVLYYYFTNKEHLYVTLIEEAYSSFLVAVREVVEQNKDFLLKLKELIHVYFECSSYDANLLRLIFGALFGPQDETPKDFIWNLEDQHIQILIQLFNEGVEQGFLASCPVETLVYQFLGSINIYLLAHLVRGKPFTQEIENHVFTLLMNGIKNRKSS